MLLSAGVGQRIVEELKSAIGRDVNIMDHRGMIVASTNPQRIGQPHDAARRLIREGLPVLEVTAAEADGGMQEGVNLPIEVDGVCEGVIGITGPCEAVRAFGSIAKKMTEILLMAQRQQSRTAQLEQARQLFLEEWLFGREVDWEAFAPRGERLDLHLEQPHRLAILLPGGAAAWSELDRTQLLQRVEEVLRNRGQTVKAVVNGRVLLLFEGESTREARRYLGEILEACRQRGQTLRAGLSPVTTRCEGLRRCYTEAKMAAETASEQEPLREYSGTSLEFILQNMEEAVQREVVEAILMPLPERERNELVECLRLYFDCDGNVEQAAERACIHKNTFRYRMRKAAEAAGCRMNRPKDLVMLYLILKFWEHLQRQPGV